MWIAVLPSACPLLLKRKKNRDHAMCVPHGAHRMCIFNKWQCKRVWGLVNLPMKPMGGKRAVWGSYTDNILSFPLSSTAFARIKRKSNKESNVFSVSASHDLFSENTESKVTSRDSHTCKDIESPLSVSKAQLSGGSGDTPKDLTNFGYKRFSNQLEKHKELDIVDDFISCSSGSCSANLAIGTHYGNAYDI